MVHAGSIQGFITVWMQHTDCCGDDRSRTIRDIATLSLFQCLVGSWLETAPSDCFCSAGCLTVVHLVADLTLPMRKSLSAVPNVFRKKIGSVHVSWVPSSPNAFGNTRLKFTSTHHAGSVTPVQALDVDEVGASTLPRFRTVVK